MIYQGLFGMEAGVLTRLPRADPNATRESAIAWSDACPRLIAAATRISAIEKMEKAKGIKRDHKQLHGKKTCIVYMSKEDKKSKIFKTLEETVEARAEAIGFPRRCARKRTARCGLAAESLSAVSAAVPNLCSVLAKVDAAYRARKEWDDAIKELHNEETRLIPQSQAGGAERRVGADGNSYTRQEFEEYYRGQRGVSWEAKWAAAKPIAGASALHARTDQGAELPATLQVFHDLQARANKVKAQKEETDTTKLQKLLSSAKVELDYIDKKEKEFDDEIRKIPPKIEGLKKENAKLDRNIKQLASTDDEEQMAAAMRARRNNRDKISELEGKKFVLNEAIEKCKKEKTDLEETMKRIGEMIGGALPSAKKQRKTKSQAYQVVSDDDSDEDDESDEDYMYVWRKP